jgi:hypothetical protein
MIRTLPVLGVMVGMHSPPALRSLLVTAANRCRPVACSVLEPPPEPAPAGYLWCGSSAHPPEQVPHAAWIGDPADVHHPVARTAAVLLCETTEAADTAGPRGVFVPESIGHSDARPVTPFVRRRLRAARGLPEPVVARAEDGRWYWGDSPVALPADLVDTAAGTASAVVATGPGLLVALAWAAPTVTDPGSAAALRAVDGVHLLVGSDPDERLRQARLLATDDAVAARLGRAGRLLARERIDCRHAAWVMLTGLGMPTHPLAGGLAALDHELDALGTPEGSPVRAAARACAAPLPSRLPAEGVHR